MGGDTVLANATVERCGLGPGKTKGLSLPAAIPPAEGLRCFLYSLHGAGALCTEGEPVSGFHGPEHGLPLRRGLQWALS